MSKAYCSDGIAHPNASGHPAQAAAAATAPARAQRITRIGSVSLSRTIELTRPLQEVFAREVCPVVMTKSEFTKRVADKEHFITSLSDGVTVTLVGELDELVNMGRQRMAEQFVGQEMLVSQSADLYYWSRQAKSSTAEVDYLAVIEGSIVPVEVKSGPSGRLRSLHLLLESLPDCERAYVFSSGPYAELPEQKLTFLPLYYAFGATRVLS